MRAKRSWAGTLALSLTIALGSMALMAATASAGWLIPPGTTFHGTQNVAGTGVAGELLVTPLGLEVSCTSSTFTGTLKELDVALATILFSGCSVLTNNFCIPYETAANRDAKTNGKNLVAKGKGLIILHGGKHYLLIEQHEGAAFSTIFFTKGSGCTLPSENAVTGSTIVELPDALTGQATHTVKVLLDMEIQLLFREVAGLGTTNSHKLLYGLESAELHGGTITAALTSGASWAGH